MACAWVLRLRGPMRYRWLGVRPMGDGWLGMMVGGVRVGGLRGWMDGWALGSKGRWAC